MRPGPRPSQCRPARVHSFAAPQPGLIAAPRRYSEQCGVIIYYERSMSPKLNVDAEGQSALPCLLLMMCMPVIAEQTPRQTTGSRSWPCRRSYRRPAGHLTPQISPSPRPTSAPRRRRRRQSGGQRGRRATFTARHDGEASYR
jgi:hypothetical protein